MCFALLVDHNALSRKMENSPTNRDLAMVLHQCEPAQMVGLAWRGFLEFILALTQSYLNCGYEYRETCSRVYIGEGRLPKPYAY